MKLKEVTYQVGSKRSEKKTWNYNPQPIDLTRVVYLRAELYDHAPNLNAVYEPKRYRTALNLYYNKPTNLDQVKDPTFRLWSWMSNYHTYRNNKYKPEGDPHQSWYENTIDKAKELNANYSSDSVVTHGCLGCVKNHESNNGGYGPHNQPRYTVDALHSLDNSEIAIMQLHIEDYNFDIDLKNVVCNNKVRVFSQEFEV